MTMITLHSERISREGKDFVILPWAEFDALQDQLENINDLIDIADAKLLAGDEPLIPYDQIKKELGLH